MCVQVCVFGVLYHDEVGCICQHPWVSDSEDSLKKIVCAMCHECTVYFDG